MRWDTWRNSTYQYNKNENGALRPAVTVLRKQINPCSIYSSNSPHKDLLHNTVTTLFLDLIYLLSKKKKKKKTCTIHI